MKKILALVMTLVLSLTAVSALAEAGKLLVGTNPEFFPFEAMDDNNNVIGFDADLAVELSKDLGVELVFESIAFDSIIPGIQSGKYDLGISGFFITEERQMNVDFSIPYLEATQACVVLKGSAVTDGETLKGKKIGSQTGTTGMTAAEDFTTEDSIMGYTSALNAFMELQGGKLDAVITDAPVAAAIMKELNDENLVVLDNVEFAKDFYGIAIPKGDTELKAKLDASIERMHNDGTIETLVKKWLTGETAE